MSSKRHQKEAETKHFQQYRVFFNSGINVQKTCSVKTSLDGFRKHMTVRAPKLDFAERIRRPTKFRENLRGLPEKVRRAKRPASVER